MTSPTSSDPVPAASSSDRPRRRLRYRGTHPRRFEEKYKEHRPEKYPEAVRKIIESGKTPAGTHRPIAVLELMEFLAPKPGETAVDCTLGYGGHAAEILQRILPGGRLLGLDVDPIELPKTEARLRLASIPPEALIVCRSNFAGLPRVLAAHDISGVDLVLADLGCSSMQLDNPERGFSFKREGPLDLRMNPAKGLPAATLLASLDAPTLADLLRENADEPRAEVIAQSILAIQARSPITTTSRLTAAVQTALSRSAPPKEREASARRVFQALRIAVNDEFSALETLLRVLPGCLNPGARVAMLTFHSGEDRRVKKAFQEGLRGGIYSDVARDVIRPSAEEVRANPRASGAKLRWALKGPARAN